MIKVEELTNVELAVLVYALEEYEDEEGCWKSETQVTDYTLLGNLENEYHKRKLDWKMFLEDC